MSRKNRDKGSTPVELVEEHLELPPGVMPDELPEVVEGEPPVERVAGFSLVTMLEPVDLVDVNGVRHRCEPGPLTHNVSRETIREILARGLAKREPLE